MQYESIKITKQEVEISIPDDEYPQASGTVTFKAPVPESELIFHDDEPKLISYKTPAPDDGVSWKQAKQLGLIRMLPYSTGSTETKLHLASLQNVAWTFPTRNGWKRIDEGDEPPLAQVWTSDYELLESRWNEFNTPEGYESQFSDVPRYYADFGSDLDKIKNSVKASVISDAFSNFDLLTNIAEGRESLELIRGLLKASIHPLQGIKELIETYKKARARGKSHRQANDDVSSQWMQYRYGIMPIVFSIQDALELLDQKADEYKTSRSRDSLSLSNFDGRGLMLDPPDIYFYDKYVGTITVGGTGKAKFENSGLRLLDQITINPFLTAWELIPMSFVIDWFVNVGDVIFSRTSTLIDASSQRKFCLSVKSDYTRVTYLHHEKYFAFSQSGEANYVDFGIWGGVVIPPVEITPAYSVSADDRLIDDIVLKTEKVKDFNRTLFEPTDVSFEFKPSLDWRRFLDGYALSLKPIRKLLKQLSK